MISRRRHPGSAAVLAAAVLCAATTAGSGAEPRRLAQATTTQKSDPLTQAPAEQKQPWTISCQENASGTVTNCQMAQHVVIRDTGKRLLSVMVEQRPTQTGLSLLILMSHGVFLPAGIALQAPGMEQIELEYRLSDAEGVYAATTLTDDLLKALQSAETLRISVVSAGRQRIGIPVSLKGFGAAFGKLTGTQ